MKDITLVIMAAGLGSRFKGGIKQLAPIGPSGEVIMDYAIYDAVKAGFNKVVFVIRKDIEQAFKEIIGDRIAKQVKVEYVFQDLNDLPEGYTCPAERSKPWGTTQAVLAAKNVVNEPFAIINADDCYGYEAFDKFAKFLSNIGDNDSEPIKMCMAGFILKNTLSENGTVKRGIASVDENNLLTAVNETFGLERKSDGNVHDEKDNIVDENSYVSMNMWGCHPKFMGMLEGKFKEFLEKERTVEGSEALLPLHVDELIKAGKITVEVLESRDKWFGVTHSEDKPGVVAAIRQQCENGVYPMKLWSE